MEPVWSNVFWRGGVYSPAPFSNKVMYHKVIEGSIAELYEAVMPKVHRIIYSGSPNTTIILGLDELLRETQ